MHMIQSDQVILKINFEKAYDKVKWSFFERTLSDGDMSTRVCPRSRFASWIKKAKAQLSVGRLA